MPCCSLVDWWVSDFNAVASRTRAAFWAVSQSSQRWLSPMAALARASLSRTLMAKNNSTAFPREGARLGKVRLNELSRGQNGRTLNVALVVDDQRKGRILDTSRKFIGTSSLLFNVHAKFLGHAHPGSQCQKKNFARRQQSAAGDEHFAYKLRSVAFPRLQVGQRFRTSLDHRPASLAPLRWGFFLTRGSLATADFRFRVFAPL